MTLLHTIFDSALPCLLVEILNFVDISVAVLYLVFSGDRDCLPANRSQQTHSIARIILYSTNCGQHTYNEHY